MGLILACVVGMLACVAVMAVVIPVGMRLAHRMRATSVGQAWMKESARRTAARSHQ